MVALGGTTTPSHPAIVIETTTQVNTLPGAEALSYCVLDD